MTNFSKHFTKKQLAEMLESSFKESLKLKYWLYETHKEILREYEDKFLNGLRLECL